MATVYGNSEGFRVQKVLVAAKVAGKTVQVKENVPADKFPLGLTPAFEEGEVRLFGSDAIVRHLAAGNKQYLPEDPALLQWFQWADSELLPSALSYVLPSISVAHVDHDTLEHAKKEFLAQLQAFDKVLASKTFLVGERLSAADVSVALNLLPAYQHVLDEKARKSLVNVTRYFLTIVNQKVVKEVVGEVKLASAVAQFSQDQYNKIKPAPKKDEKKETKKPEKKKEDKPKPAAQEPEEDEPSAPVEKFVDPFLKFPAGKFNLDGFKRVYSNEDTDKSIPWFWENFEPENYSIWYGEYKYPKELTLTFMSCNLISGMFQRLEKLKKHAFASVCLFGTDNDSSISGIWIWRGHELAFELSPDWQVDYESYSWKKLDPATRRPETSRYWLGGRLDGRVIRKFQ
uniref:eEF-1B gamma n=1 Tax=Bursaphelenchus xylophilus TaxID=6326 RepID=D1MBR3_BURXY|nr:elongation factor 1 gamma [Bursaphelenchus xylophilus]